MDADFEKQLVEKICQRIGARGFCVIYNNDLCQLSQPLELLRAQQVRDIQRFARKNGFAVEIRDIGLNATFRRLEGKDGASAGARRSAQLSARR